MIIKRGSDWKRYIVNCREDQLRDKLKQIANKGGKIVGRNVCPELQAMIKGEGEVDIWVETTENIMDTQLEKIIGKITVEPTETTVT